MAGVPSIMQAMLESLKPQLERGAPMLSVTVTAFIGEGDLAKPLKEIQDRYREVVIGSYPFEEQGNTARTSFFDRGMRPSFPRRRRRSKR